MSWFFGLIGGKRDGCAVNCVGRSEAALDDISRRCSALAEQLVQWHVRETAADDLDVGAIGGHQAQ